MTCYLFIGTNFNSVVSFSEFKHSAKQNCYRGVKMNGERNVQIN